MRKAIRISLVVPFFLLIVTAAGTAFGVEKAIVVKEEPEGAIFFPPRAAANGRRGAEKGGPILSLPSDGMVRGGLACSYTGLVSGISDTAIANPDYFIANQSHVFWTAVGIRSEPGDDWDLEMCHALGTAPQCVDTLAAGSYRFSGVDVVVADFNSATPAARYIKAIRSSGAGSALIEWDSGTDILQVNGGAVIRSTGPGDVLEIWDVYLQGGLDYGISLSWTGDAQLRYLVWSNSTGGLYEDGRSGALLDTLWYDWFTPLQTGYCGIAVINENGGNADYNLEVGTCLSPAPLTSAVPVHLPRGFHHFSFQQTASYWTAIATRTDIPGTSWWNFAYPNGSGAQWPNCFSNPVGGGYGFTYQGRSISITVLNFNSGGLPLGTYYAETYPESTDTSGATLEWDAGVDLLVLGDTPVYVPTDSNDVIEVWDIYLDTLVPYNAVITTTGDAAPLGLLFANDYIGPPNSVSVQAMGLPAPGAGICETFFAGPGGFQGFGVVNFNGGTGTFGVSVAEAFREVADTVLQNPVDSRGCSWVDFDGDGDLDIHVTNNLHPNRLFVNDGFGNFSDGAAPPIPFPANWLVSKWGDYDNDGDPDVAISSNNSRIALFRNESGAGFSDVPPRSSRLESLA